MTDERSSEDEALEAAFAQLVQDVDAFACIDRALPHLLDVATPLDQAQRCREDTLKKKARAILVARTQPIVDACRKRRRQYEMEHPPPKTDDQSLWQLARFAPRVDLRAFAEHLEYVPRVVNVVTLVEASPVPGSNQTLPLDLLHIASRCTGAYFASRRFAAVQLAYSQPRCRVLVFRESPRIEQQIRSAPRRRR
jgi:hypothetical protein